MKKVSELAGPQILKGPEEAKKNKEMNEELKRKLRSKSFLDQILDIF